MKKVISFAMSMMRGASLLYGCTSGTASTSLQSEETASSSSSASDSTEEESCMIGMSVPSMNNPYFIYIEDIIKSKVEANGDTFVSFDPQYDPMKQISQIEDMITQGIDVLILCPYDSQGIRPALEACKEKGVLVVNFDNRVMDTDLADAILVSDNYNAGKVVGERVNEDFPDGAKVAILNSPVGESTMDRENGFKEALNDNIEVVAIQDGKGELQTAMEPAENILQAHPDLDAFFAVTDQAALGCVAVLEGAGKAGQVHVYGIDGSPDGKKAMQDGTMHGSGAQSPKGLAEGSVDLAYRLLAGETFENEEVVETFLISPDNLDEYGVDSWQ